MGMLLAPTEEHKRGDISLHMTSLMQHEEDCFDFVEENDKKSYFLHDNLHKYNTNTVTELLRHTFWKN